MECLLKDPGIYLDELQHKLYHRAAVLASLPTICNTIHRLGYTRKRIGRVVQAQDVMRRAEFMAEMSYLKADMMIWIDETGSDHRVSSRCFGYHLRGLAPTDTVLSIRGKRLSAVAAMSTRGIEDIDICEGTTNGETFTRFLERCIVPILQPFNGSNPRSVVVLDNASIHHSERIQQLIDATGALIRYLPPYSPDLNPIEEVFAQVKQFLKGNHLAYHCTSEPRIMLTAAFNSVEPVDCLNYIEHAGYTFE